MAEIAETRGSVSIVARRHGINSGQLFRWRRDIGATRGYQPDQQPTFAPVLLAPPAATETVNVNPKVPVPARIEIELVGGRMVRVDPEVDVGKLARIIAALEAKA